MTVESLFVLTGGTTRYKNAIARIPKGTRALQLKVKLPAKHPAPINPKETKMSALSYLENRALTAYYSHGRKAIGEFTGSVNQPGQIVTTEVDGLTYIVLANVNAILAVYRVRTVNGAPMLKGMKRWPAEIDRLFGAVPEVEVEFNYDPNAIIDGCDVSLSAVDRRG